jgi:hypothetical protein
VLVIASLLGLIAFAPPAHALGTSELLDLAIQAIEPQLQPAKPLIVCLIGGKTLQSCVEQEVQKQTGAVKQEATDQAAATLPFDPNDNRITQIVAVVTAASQGKWLEVVNKGGTTFGKMVVCGSLPPGVKSVGCPVTDHVIDNNKQLIDDAWDAVKGPDWWALAQLLGPQTACQFIPVAEIKSTLCGPLGAAIEAAAAVVQGGAKVVTSAFGDASELLINFTEDIGGQDPPMAPDKYFMTYWYVHTHWYVLSALTVNYTTPPDMKLEYDSCVGYFDGHKASKSTAQKWCGKMRQQAQAQFTTALNAIKAAPAVYLKGTLDPQLPRLALEYFHAPASPMMPGTLFTDCVSAVRDGVPVPGVLPQQNIMHGKWNSSPVTGWEWACKQVAIAFEPAFQSYKNQSTPAISAKMSNLGCKIGQPTKGDTRLRFLCDNWAGFNACKSGIAALGGKDESGHCGIDGSTAAIKLAAQLAAQLGSKRCTVPVTNTRAVQCTRPWKVEQCKTLVEQAQGGSVGWAYEVSCLAKDDPAFIAGQAQVKNLLFTLNGGVGSKTDTLGTKPGQGGTWAPATGKDCQSSQDPLAITCNSLDVLAAHDISLPGCPADPGHDGADAPCLMTTLHAVAGQAGAKAGPVFSGPLKSNLDTRSPAARIAPIRSPATNIMRTTPSATAMAPAQAPMATAVSPAPAPAPAPAPTAVMAPEVPAAVAPAPSFMRMTPAVSIPGCELLTGQSAVFICPTREALATCERQRIANPAAVRGCRSN